MADKLNLLTLGAARSYTDSVLKGMGAIKGAACQIQGVTPITGGNRITFLWEDNEGVSHTSTLDVMDGVKGDTGNGVKSADIVNNHLILTLDDDTTVDAGLLTNLDTTFEHIADISLNNLADGQILKFNAITGKWENASAGTVDTRLVDLNDVAVDNLTDGQIIVWDATAGRWKNADNSPSITVDPTPTQGSNNAVASGGVYTALQSKADSSDVPTKTSDLTNDSNFVADASYVHTDNNYTSADKTIVGGVTAALADKVDKVSGKGLSTNDYTTAEKTKLTGIATGANKKHKKLFTLTANTWQASQSDYGVYTYSLTISDPYFDINEPLNVYFADGHDSYDDPYFNNAKYKVYKNIYNGEYGGSVEDYPSQLILYYYDVENLTAPPTTINIYVEGIIRERGV